MKWKLPWPLSNRSAHTRILTGILTFFTAIPWVQAQENILVARQRPLGSVVTIIGTTLNGSELGDVRYLQDSTAGIAIYPGGSSPASFSQVVRGDKVQVTGVLSTYHGLLEVNPILSYQKISSGNTLPEPAERSADGLTALDQGRLIRITCTQFNNKSALFDSGNQTFYTSNGESGTLYLEGNHPLTGSALPTSAVDLTVIVSYYDGFRFLPRSGEDISPADCFRILPTPEQRNIVQSGFQVDWKSNTPGQGFCIITDPDGMATILEDPMEDVTHSIVINTLTPAEIYRVQTGVINPEGDTALFPAIPMATKSTSSGLISIYFDQSVNPVFSNGSHPDGTSFSAMLASVMDLINAAQNTIDVAMYNSNRSDIITALKQATQRGVRVRYIADGGQSNSALDPLPTFPLMFRNGDGIMHDKFLVFDVEDPDRAVVWTGSTNHSTNQLSQDPNNTVVIHDQTLAKVYTMEFEEMWGGSGNSPNPLMSRTGSAKIDNTPHLFQIGDIAVESYFSPSDNTNAEILSNLNAAEHNIAAALLLLTRYDLAEAMGARQDDGVPVRVIIDDLESSVTPVNILRSHGALVAHHDFNSIFHHKYAIIDEGTSDAVLITGSHNWTASATLRNDENTLVFHDPDIANVYRQEFEARWSEVVPTSVEGPFSEPIALVYPNPVSDLLYIDSPIDVQSISLTTATGISVRTALDTKHQLDVSSLPAGMYFITLHFLNGSVQRHQIVRQ